VISENRVAAFFTTPTAFRAIKQPESSKMNGHTHVAGNAPDIGTNGGEGRLSYSQGFHSLSAEISGSLPFSENGEKGVLCSLLLSPSDVVQLCRQRIPQDTFYIPAHQILYGLCLECIQDGRPIDFVPLKQALKDRNQLGEIGRSEFLSDLYSFVPSAANASHYIGIVHQKWPRRKVILDCRRRKRRL
jgi:DnaB-like helicase N terminal domain